MAMNEITLTVLGTVVSGVIVFIVGEYLKEALIVPYHKYREFRGKVAHHLVLYSNRISNPSGNTITDRETYRHISNELRELAAELVALNTVMVSSKQKKNKRKDTISRLINLSNCLVINNNSSYLDTNQENLEIIRENLDIKRFGA